MECCCYQQVTAVCVHVLVHEVEDGEPQGRERAKGQQRGQVLQKHLEQGTTYRD